MLYYDSNQEGGMGTGGCISFMLKPKQGPISLRVGMEKQEAQGGTTLACLK